MKKGLSSLDSSNFLLNNSKYMKNNSSMFTAENSSFLSKINNRKNRLSSTEDGKYSNTVIFSNIKRGKSNNYYKNKIRNKGELYLTELNNSSSDGREANYKSFFQLTDIDHDIKKREIKKDSLPNIASYNRYLKTPSCFTCCDTKLYPKYLTRLYNEQEMKNHLEKLILTKKANIRTLKDDKINYLRKTNDIKRIKYEIYLKKESMMEYKDNLKNHINSLNYTISTLKSYQENLKHSFLNKYNESLRILNAEIIKEKKILDKQNQKLLDLNNDVSSLELQIEKKILTLKKIKKWLILQIHIKEGVKPDNLDEALEKRYNKKLIFETAEELDIILKNKENKNLRLMTEFNKCDEEKKYYIAELLDLEKHIGNIKQDMDTIITERQNQLTNLKKKKIDLDISLNELNSLKRNYLQININSNNKRSKSVASNKMISNSNEGEIVKNELGIYYKPITIHNNLFISIDATYNSIVKNNIDGLYLNEVYINDINNINTSKSKRAIIQMKIIEIGLNYLLDSIQNKIKNNKDNLKILEDTRHLTDLYHKRVNGDKNKEEILERRNILMKRIDEKNRKIYLFPRGKIEKYNIVGINLIKKKEKLKHKRIIKKIDIWDFLHDQLNKENFINENSEK